MADIRGLEGGVREENEADLLDVVQLSLLEGVSEEKPVLPLGFLRCLVLGR